MCLQAAAVTAERPATAIPNFLSFSPLSYQLVAHISARNVTEHETYLNEIVVDWPLGARRCGANRKTKTATFLVKIKPSLGSDSFTSSAHRTSLLVGQIQDILRKTEIDSLAVSGVQMAKACCRQARPQHFLFAPRPALENKETSTHAHGIMPQRWNI